MQRLKHISCGSSTRPLAGKPMLFLIPSEISHFRSSPDNESYLCWASSAAHVEGLRPLGDHSEWTDEPGKDLDPVSREAVTWFAAMHADDVTASTRSAFRAWLRRDVRHQAAYADIERIWSAASDLPAVKSHRRASRLALTRRALGKAVIAAAIGGGGWLAYQQYFLGDYRTGAGERRSIRLPDNSNVELAGATAVSLDFRPQLRLVILHKGEAFFSTTEDNARPFVVEAGAGRTMASGAAFNIDYVADDDVHVTVLEKAADIRLGLADVRVGAGRQVNYSRKTIGSPNTVDPMEALAWREGRLVFVSAPFGRVVASLNRWRSGKFVIMSPSLMERPVTLIVDINNIDDVPAVLKDSLSIRLVNVTPYVTFIMAT